GALLGREEGGVVLVGVPGGDPRGAAGAPAADEDGQPGLGGLGERGAAGELVVGAVEVVGAAGLGGPQPGDDLQLLLEPGEPLLGEGNAVRPVLLLEPSRAQAEFDPP